MDAGGVAGGIEIEAGGVDDATGAGSAGGVSVTVTAYPDNIEFRVSDAGVGIAPDALPMIFDMFRQGDSSMTRRHEGLGLGLYLVKRMLDLLGGTIAVDSEVGRGSTFQVWMPATMGGGVDPHDNDSSSD